MALAEQLQVQVRVPGGKQAAKRLRLTGKIPGTVYSHGTEPVSVEVEGRDFKRILRAHGRTAALVKLDGLPKGGTLALYKRLQFHPVTQDPIHIDFQAVRADEKIRVRVPVRVTGLPVGVDKEGGSLVQTAQLLMVECLPTGIPDAIVVDVTHLALHQAVHVSDIKFPDGVTPVTAGSTAVASVQVTREFKEPEKPAAAVAEGAVPAEGAAAAAPGAEAGKAPAAGAKPAAGGEAAKAAAPAGGDKGAKPAGGGDKKK